MAKHRGDKRGSRRSEWGDEGSSDFQEPSFFSRRAERSQSNPVEAEVLWFNSSKGFGFVQLSDGENAFIHVKQLEAAGLKDIAEGTRLRVIVEPGEKGPSVASVTEIVSTPALPPGRQEEHRSSKGQDNLEAEITGTVKWYNAEKGFGFIARADGGKDIFVHASALSRSSISTLEEGQSVKVRYAEGKKGPEARTVYLA